jgi:hypothetical protein
MAGSLLGTIPMVAARKPVLKRVHAATSHGPAAVRVQSISESPTTEIEVPEVIRHESEIRALRPNASSTATRTGSWSFGPPADILDEITELHADAILEEDDLPPTQLRVPPPPAALLALVQPPPESAAVRVTSPPPPPIAFLPKVARAIETEPPAAPPVIAPAPVEVVRVAPAPSPPARSGQTRAMLDACIEGPARVGAGRAVLRVLFSPVTLIAYLYNSPSLVAKGVLVLMWMALCSAITLLVTR